MVDEVSPNIYRIEIPLPGSPLKALNSYVLRSGDRFLIVDTGWDKEECLHAMLSGLKELDVDLERTDIILTHFHADHFGLTGTLIRKNTRVYMGEKDAAIALFAHERTEERRKVLCDSLFSYGFPAPELQRAIEHHPGFRYGPLISFPLNLLKDGDDLEFGNSSLTCVETPGHTPGHMCLYDAKKKILLTGDHILFDITPNITYWPEMENALGEYFLSLEKVGGLDVRLVLPGHRSIMKDHRGRISELLTHHEKRLGEALGALGNGEKTAWEVAPHLSWDIDCRSWEAFPPAQKWFAMGETIAHLNYLAARGDIVSREHKGRILFSLT